MIVRSTLVPISAILLFGLAPLTAKPEPGAPERKVWALKRAGEWKLTGGIKLVIEQEQPGLSLPKTTAWLH